MHIHTPAWDASIDRRNLVKSAAALGALALVAPLAGCDALGIVDPYANQVDEVEVPGTVDFDGLDIALDLNESNWQWSQFENMASSYNGSLVVGIPLTATNNDAQTRVLSSIYCTIVDPNGTALPDISAYYTGTDILQSGPIGVGKVTTAMVHILFDGPGTYTLKFDNLLGQKAELPLTIASSQASGLRPLPSQLSSTDAETAVPYGTAFEASGFTLMLSANEGDYIWIQSWDEYNPDWNGRWCVGVPITVTNTTSTPMELSIDMYGLYAPWLYRQGDPAPWFADSAIAYRGAIAPGGSIEAMMWWPYDGDGWYYAAFDNYGARAVASARIAQYS